MSMRPNAAAAVGYRRNPTCSLLVFKALPLLAAAVGGDFQVFDERCWVHAEQADRLHCDLREPCRSDCWSNFFSHSYCCMVDSTCWWWGRDAAGDVVRVDAARSGVECRHLCQAEPSCAVWSYEIPAARDPEASGRCLLRSLKSGEVAAPGKPAASVVSGPRICPSPAKAPHVAAAALETLAERSEVVFETFGDDWAVKAAAAILQEGWAVVRGALPADKAAALERAAAKEAQELIARDVYGFGNRGPRRYSFGGASQTHHMVHVAEWAELLDNAVVSQVLDVAFAGPYVAVGGGGDFVLGRTDTHQRLHVDLQLAEMYDLEAPPAAISANFAVNNVTCDDGPMRLLPRTQRLPLALAEEATRAAEELSRASGLEKEWAIQAKMNLNAVKICPLQPGDVLLRDMRVWHGGTPNLGDNTRLLPSAEFLSPWYADLASGTEDHFAPRPSLPFAHWWRMSKRSRQATARILSVPGPVRHGIRPNFELMLPYVAEDRA
eukprot:TRINITY_DN50343_c0_g1_i2.p1 TRINITY_DN50343_c0_g1~~TRINITY_DN50343_c0_g1_i2.p1  ORF type:complete len:494 (-),score=97.45 TRINITY_DN50343_c0_g1_i2:26-1507(-)